ncbi:hypothetical protein M758_3G003000 [Ceratodon purpureus]|uniref:Gag1-like clamp domain-containing protein n=1 Tax=Ceratodon purpureus TaxID=3225 RepID=A0A8T0IED2_CERPU|nr:hypothetical protein KC19_3G005300 [Ceratodon purpureus]KAG0621226.1 hypothetical protein M758_3G003000 [Ceratodon purpureus]
MQNLRLGSWTHWIHALQLLRRSACMGGCLGGYVRPPPAALPEKVNRTFKRSSNRRSRGQSARSSQDWWMSSSHEMDDNRSVLNSQALRKFSRSVNDSLESGSASNNNDKFSFENHALNHWHKQRQEWVGSRRVQQRGLREPVIKWSSTYEELLGTSRPFTQPVPLPEMVDFLVDVWEQEGLYG